LLYSAERDTGSHQDEARGKWPFFQAEQSAAPDCLQRPLLRRARFQQQVSASVGHQKHKEKN
jgi:hypothetical protein